MQMSVDSCSVAADAETTRSRSPLLRHAVYAALAGASLCAPTLFVNAQEAPAADASEQASEASGDDVTQLSDMSVTEDPLRALSNEPSGASFGFAKPLLETPRAVSFVSEEQIRLFGVSTVEDLSRVVPGTYTTTRYGLQGGINVRGVSADIYYRGMKRLNQQGHVRTVLSAFDNIEVVKGPPSPLFGMGKIGGYTVVDPKSSRARTGKYLTKGQGYFQGTVGGYDKNEVQLGLGLPFTTWGERAGGVYIVALLEDSKTFVKNVEAHQKFLQAATNIDNFVGPFRLEVGGQVQNSVTAGAYMNRVTQELLDDGIYVSGRPLVNMDLNGDGRIGYVEAFAASPVAGNMSTNNLYLNQRWSWRSDPSTGAPLPINMWEYLPPVPGIPAAMKSYLNSPEGMRDATCSMANYMRSAAVPVGGPVPQSGFLPPGFVLNPCTVQKRKVDYRGNGAYEREQNADQKLGYLDLIYDTDPDFTVRSQLFYDNIDSFKDSWLPYGENQYIKTVEEKITVTKRIPDAWLPGWLRVNSLASVNYRETSGFIRSSGGDFDYRQDIHYQQGVTGSGMGGHYANTMFWTQLTNGSYATGTPATSWRESSYDERGVGVMFDVDFRPTGTNLVLGARYDKSGAETQNIQPFNNQDGRGFTYNPNDLTAVSTGGFFNVSAGRRYNAQEILDGELARDFAMGAVDCQTTASTNQAQARAATCPGFFYTGPVSRAKNTDSGKSWSASISQHMPWGLRPYFTAAQSSITLDSANNLLDTGPINAGHIGTAYLREAGLKGSFFRGKLQASVAGFRQSRNDISANDDPTAGADVTSTMTEGIEAEVKWVPTRELFISAYFTRQMADYIVDAAANLEVNGRQIGFQDIVDPTTGEVFPAEAFLYGGRSSVQLPAGTPGYRQRVANPESQASIQSTYRMANGLGFLVSGNWFSEVWANRQKTLLVPEAYTFNVGVTFDKGNWHFKLNGYNITDEVYFRPGGDSNGQILSVMPRLRWEASLKVDF